MRRPLLGAVVGLALLGGCSSGDDDAAAASSSTAPAATATSTSSSAAASSSSGGGASGCAPAGDGVPAGADAEPTIDVDGDGQPDTEWIATQIGADGAVTFGVTTASGSTFTSQIRSASPVA